MNLAVSINNLSKKYKLGVFGSGTLYRDLQSFIARLRNKEDPNSPIGVNTISNKNKNPEFTALKNINLNIAQGEILGIIGHNGAGKSTLLKILSKVTSPSSGSIKYNGRLSSLLEVGTGFHPELTGRENIYLNCAINGLNKNDIDQRINSIIEFAEIKEHLDTPVKRYSSGMYVRLGFAVAAFLEPEILVVDEVLAVGDAAFQKKALGKMREVSKKGERTILFVSHNMSSIASLCTRCIQISNGQVVNDGKPDEVIRKYLLSSNHSMPTIKKIDIDKNTNETMFNNIRSFEFNQIGIFNKNGEKKLNFESAEDIYIKFDFECFRKIQDFRLITQIGVKTGEKIISTVFTDDENMIKYRNINKGKYSWKLKIPKNTFGNCDILLSFCLLDHGIHHYFLNNIFKLNIKFVGYNNITHLVDNTPIKLKFEWDENIN